MPDQPDNCGGQNLLLLHNYKAAKYIKIKTLYNYIPLGIQTYKRPLKIQREKTQLASDIVNSKRKKDYLNSGMFCANFYIGMKFWWF